MRIGIALIAAVLFLAGCANCQVASFYKPSTHGDSRLHSDAGLPTYVGFSLGEVPFSVAVCADRYLAAPGDTLALCIFMDLGAASSLRFSVPTVTIAVGSSPPAAVSLAAVEYEILCRVENGQRTCTSTEESPIAGPVRKVAAKGLVDRYAFDPSFEFRGARDTLHEGAWLGHRLAGKRRYAVRTVVIPVQRGAGLSVQLPEMIVNGRAFTPPMLTFRAVTEEVCRMVPLA